MSLLIDFKGCDTCSLKSDWPKLKSPVMPVTRPTREADIKILVLGEAPGKEEDEENKQFVGKTGQYLRTYMPSDWQHKVYWQNTVRCRPTNPDGRSNRAPTEREAKCCSVHLEKDILDIRPHVILCIGVEALAYFWPDAPPISKIRGIPFPAQVGDHVFWVFSTFHPSYVTRAERENWADGTTVNPVLPVFKNDLKLFFNSTDKFRIPPKISIPTKSILYPKSYDEAMALFAKLKDPWGLDYENRKLKPYHRDARLLTAALSDGELTFAFPVNWPGDPNPWGKRALQTIIESGREWVAQHANHEVVWTTATTGVKKLNFHDLEVVARLSHKRKGLGSLDVISRIYMGIDIKELTNKSLAGQYLGPLDKNRIAEYPVETILEYNGLDAWAEIVLFRYILDRLPDDQLDNYLRSIETIKSSVAMELNGLAINLEQSELQDKALFTQMQAFEKRARELAEIKEFERKEQKLFTLSKPETVGHVLVNYCHVPLENTAEKGQKPKYSVDEEVLEKIADASPLIPLRLDFVEVQKLRSTYVKPILNGSILGVDGLIHGAYNVVFTNTYRLSSDGPNMQNWPKRKHKEVRRQIVAPPGYIFAAYDYGQLEARGVVMSSKDRVLKQDFINKVDIHSMWLNRLLEIYPPYLTRLADKTGQTEEAKIRKSGRDIIKTDFVFASLYGSVAKSIATRAMLPMEVATQLLGEFWKRYAGVKTWIDGQFRLYQATGSVHSLTGRARNEVMPGNEVINTPIQGIGAEIVLEAQNALYNRALEQDDIAFMPRINIHDDILFVLPDTPQLEWYIKEIGQAIVYPRFPFVNLPLTSECRIGYNWADLEAITVFEGQWFEHGALTHA